jgi:hypothetical protein
MIGHEDKILTLSTSNDDYDGEDNDDDGRNDNIYVEDGGNVDRDDDVCDDH